MNRGSSSHLSNFLGFRSCRKVKSYCSRPNENFLVLHVLANFSISHVYFISSGYHESPAFRNRFNYIARQGNSFETNLRVLEVEKIQAVFHKRLVFVQIGSHLCIQMHTEVKEFQLFKGCIPISSIVTASLLPSGLFHVVAPFCVLSTLCQIRCSRAHIQKP